MIGSVARLTRFPVKSTAGEHITSTLVDARGLVHDRGWAAYTADGGIASGKTTRRFRRVDGMMLWRSTISADDVLLHAPDGTGYSVLDPAASAALSSALGQPLELRPETNIAHHDASGVHLLTTSSLRAAADIGDAEPDHRRFRANIVIDTDGTGFVEDGWVGAVLAIGSEVTIRVGAGMQRCVMIDRPQADVTPKAPLLRALGRYHDTAFGAEAEVLTPGRIAEGDPVRLVR
ncbi:MULTISPECIES: MOSC domain-containing protein [unclassified Nocardia]|uniref:MOSC domain-containing protein n=1 Tax=unclassified Nocardia TaxID=2637762 RepID=UPI001CE4A630|nr:MULTISPECIES: MOSC N-terminal beta barrel domain-containing protein [unclassified Nocardia]